MKEEYLLSIRNLLIAKKAQALRGAVRDTDSPEDIMETAHVMSDGTNRRILKWEAALRIAVQDHLDESAEIARLMAQTER